MSHRLVTATAALLCLAACGSDGPTGSGGATSSMSASVDGSQFTPRSIDITGSRVGNAITFSGEHEVNGVTTIITIALPNVTVPGTLALGPTFASQFARVSIGGGSAPRTGTWSTTLSPGSGSVTVNAIAAQRIAGTFQFTAQFEPGTGSTGQVSVTSGTFDIRF